MAAKKTTKKRVTKKKAKTAKGSSKAGYDLVVKMLERDKNVDYATVKAAADKKGLSIYPIVYGRAKAALGLVKVSKRGEAKARREAAKRSGAKRGTGRPRKGTSSDGIQAIIDQIKSTERERDRAIATLTKIRDMIDAAL